VTFGEDIPSEPKDLKSRDFELGERFLGVKKKSRGKKDLQKGGGRGDL